MQEGQKTRKNMVDTNRAFQFKNIKSYHAIEPGENPKVKYKGLLKEKKWLIPKELFNLKVVVITL